MKPLIGLILSSTLPVKDYLGLQASLCDLARPFIAFRPTFSGKGYRASG